MNNTSYVNRGILELVLGIDKSAHLYILEILLPHSSNIESLPRKLLYKTEGKDHQYNNEKSTNVNICLNDGVKESLIQKFLNFDDLNYVNNSKDALDTLVIIVSEALRFHTVGNAVADALNNDQGNFVVNMSQIKKWDAGCKNTVLARLPYIKLQVGDNIPTPESIAVLSYRPFHYNRILDFWTSHGGSRYTNIVKNFFLISRPGDDDGGLISPPEDDDGGLNTTHVKVKPHKGLLSKNRNLALSLKKPLHFSKKNLSKKPLEEEFLEKVLSALTISDDDLLKDVLEVYYINLFLALENEKTENLNDLSKHMEDLIASFVTQHLTLEELGFATQEQLAEALIGQLGRKHFPGDSTELSYVLAYTLTDPIRYLLEKRGILQPLIDSSDEEEKGFINPRLITRSIKNSERKQESSEEEEENESQETEDEQTEGKDDNPSHLIREPTHLSEHRSNEFLQRYRSAKEQVKSKDTLKRPRLDLDSSQSSSEEDRSSPEIKRSKHNEEQPRRAYGSPTPHANAFL